MNQHIRKSENKIYIVDNPTLNIFCDIWYVVKCGGNTRITKEVSSKCSKFQMCIDKTYIAESVRSPEVVSNIIGPEMVIKERRWVGTNSFIKPSGVALTRRLAQYFHNTKWKTKLWIRFYTFAWRTLVHAFTATGCGYYHSDKISISIKLTTTISSLGLLVNSFTLTSWGSNNKENYISIVMQCAQD